MKKKLIFFFLIVISFYLLVKESKEYSPEFATHPKSNTFIDAIWDVRFNYDLQAATGGLGNALAVYIPKIDRIWIILWSTSAGRIYVLTRAGVKVDSFTTSGFTGARNKVYDPVINEVVFGVTTNILYKVNPITSATIGQITMPTTVTARFISYHPTADGGAGSFWVGNMNAGTQQRYTPEYLLNYFRFKNKKRLQEVVGDYYNDEVRKRIIEQVDIYNLTNKDKEQIKPTEGFVRTLLAYLFIDHKEPTAGNINMYLGYSYYQNQEFFNELNKNLRPTNDAFPLLGRDAAFWYGYDKDGEMTILANPMLLKQEEIKPNWAQGKDRQFYEKVYKPAYDQVKSEFKPDGKMTETEYLAENLFKSINSKKLEYVAKILREEKKVNLIELGTKFAVSTVENFINNVFPIGTVNFTDRIALQHISDLSIAADKAKGEELNTLFGDLVDEKDKEDGKVTPKSVTKIFDTLVKREMLADLTGMSFNLAALIGMIKKLSVYETFFNRDF